MRRTEFGDDFVWGVACAAAQVEGGRTEGGRGRSIWDDAARRGRIAGGDPFGRAIDFFHRWEEDLDHVAAMGHRAFRFSISWSRVLPEGVGPVSEAGLAFYDRVVDGCLARGLEPWITLFHWDTPSALQERGGWEDRQVVDWFGEYASVVIDAFGHKVRRWMVLNEPNVYAGFWREGRHQGRRGLHLRSSARMEHHQNLAVGDTSRLLRERVPGAVIGTTAATWPAVATLPDHPGAPRATAVADAVSWGTVVQPLTGRGYPDALPAPLRWLLDAAVVPGDLERCRADLDFFGVQYYAPVSMRPARVPVVGSLPVRQSRPGWPRVRTEMGWPVHAPGLAEVLGRVHATEVAPRLVVTENGAAFPDLLDGDRVHDDLRVWYYREHLASVRRAQRAGVPVDGYFCWSYADNVEWFEGTRPRFGLIYVDYDDDLRRVPKDSARWFTRFLGGDEV